MIEFIEFKDPSQCFHCFLRDMYFQLDFYRMRTSSCRMDKTLIKSIFKMPSRIDDNHQRQRRSGQTIQIDNRAQ